MSEMTPSVCVILAKTLDALVMPVMSMLVYIVPNFGALDVSNMVAERLRRELAADGAQHIAWPSRTVLPFSFAGYLIWKNSGGRRMNPGTTNLNKKNGLRLWRSSPCSARCTRTNPGGGFVEEKKKPRPG